MVDKRETKPSAPSLPKYIREPLERQSPSRLESVSEYATALAAWKRRKEKEELTESRRNMEIEEEETEELESRGISTDPADYDEVPDAGAYITIKTTKQTGDKAYQYYYWQWRDGDTWENEYIAPVNQE